MYAPSTAVNLSQRQQTMLAILRDPEHRDLGLTAAQLASLTGCVDARQADSALREMRDSHLVSCADGRYRTVCLPSSRR